MQKLTPRREIARHANEPHGGRAGLAILVLMAVLSPLLSVATAPPAPAAATPPRLTDQAAVTGTCLNSTAAQTNISLTMHNIFLIMAGIGGGLVVIAIVYWGIIHAASSAFEEASAEQKMKRKKQLFDILVGGVMILAASTAWALIAGAVVGSPC